MRISDWSSDVCSSDLVSHGIGLARTRNPQQRLVHQAVAYAFDQSVDCGRLIACRQIRLIQLERAVGVFDEAGRGSVHTGHFQGKPLIITLIFPVSLLTFTPSK